MTLSDFLYENWTTLLTSLGSLLGMGGWIMERGKRMRDNRASDVAFWEQTIEKQNAYIERQDARIALIEEKYEQRIKVLEGQNVKQREEIDFQRKEINQLQTEVEDLTTRLEKHEPVRRTKPIKPEK